MVLTYKSGRSCDFCSKWNRFAIYQNSKQKIWSPYIFLCLLMSMKFYNNVFLLFCLVALPHKNYTSLLWSFFLFLLLVLCQLPGSCSWIFAIVSEMLPFFSWYSSQGEERGENHECRLLLSYSSPPLTPLFHFLRIQ